MRLFVNILIRHSIRYWAKGENNYENKKSFHEIKEDIGNAAQYHNDRNKSNDEILLTFLGVFEGR